VSAELRVNAIHIEGTELLDGLVTSVFLLDQDLQVDYLNAAAQNLLAVGPNQARGRSITELARGAEALLPLFERARQGSEGVVQRELAWPAPGGVDRILDCAVTQVTLGNNFRFLLEVEDITQHRRLTRENALLAQLGGSRLMVRQGAFFWFACWRTKKKPRGGVARAPRNCSNGSSSIRRCASTRASSSAKRTGSPICSTPCWAPAARPRNN
jgi:hypothetical protein